MFWNEETFGVCWCPPILEDCTSQTPAWCQCPMRALGAPERSKYSSKSASVCAAAPWALANTWKAFWDKTLRLGSLLAHQGILCRLMWYWVWAWEIKVRLRNSIKISLDFFTLSAKWAVKGAKPRTLRELRRTCSRISTMPEYYLSSLNANKSCSLSKQPCLFRSFQSTCSLAGFLERKTPFSHLKWTPKWGSHRKVPG